MKILKHIENIGSGLKSLFLSGLFTILPIAATIFVVTFTYNILARWLYPLKQLEPMFLQNIPAAEFVIVTLAILMIGALIKFLLITPIIHYFERVIAKIPLIRTVYSSAKTLVDFFDVPNPATASKKVVLIEYPREGSFNIAFLLGSAEDNFRKLIPKEKAGAEEYFKVFMPNSPNPTSGYFFILPESSIIHTDITFEEAIKAVVSCGLITPETITKLP